MIERALMESAKTSGGVESPQPLWVVLAMAADQLGAAPEEVERLTLDVLKRIPGQQHALMLLVTARKARGDTAGARTLLEVMADERPEIAAIHFELGALLDEMGESKAAIRALSRLVALEPKHPSAWRLLGEALADSGDMDKAADAYFKHFELSALDLKTLEAAAEFGPEQADIAEKLLHDFLMMHPTDVAATHALGKLYLKQDLFAEAEPLLARVVEFAPDLEEGVNSYQTVLQHQGKWSEQLECFDALLKRYPEHSDHRFRQAGLLARFGDHDASLEAYEALLRDHPDVPHYMSGYAHELRAFGRRDESIAAHRKAIEMDPGHGQGWWSLAALKNYRFSAPEIDLMRAQLACQDLADEPRYYLHFALGEALEHAGEFRDSFEHYRRGNAMRRGEMPYSAGETSRNVSRIKKQFTRDFFQRHAGMGSPAADPIFIIGMPRSGSTLVEQILSSHSAIEGAGELPCFLPAAMACERLASEAEDEDAPLDFDAPALRRVAYQYLHGSKIFRKLGTPLFTDKAPANFHHLGIICATFPNAKIIDTRRNPLACCFSNYKQLFPAGVAQSYDLADMGRYYRDYVDLMAHFDAVLPGRVHRVIYEELIANPENQVRALLAYCGVPFEEECLHFHQSSRAVLTVSSEQVKQPIYAGANEVWRHYEEWLGPLKAALGPVTDSYPAAPPADER
jgi:tetratricopeptide (TPR) repeat protein